MSIENVPTKSLGALILQLVQNGLTFKARPLCEDFWTIEILGGY